MRKGDEPGHGSALAQLVELLATSGTEATSAAANVTDARRALGGIPDGAIAQVRDVQGCDVRRGSTGIRPLLDVYVDFSERLPAILGWNEPRRYLILTQDPAEIRPTGGFVGSYGIVAFDNGSITELPVRGCGAP